MKILGVVLGIVGIILILMFIVNVFDFLSGSDDPNSSNYASYDAPVILPTIALIVGIFLTLAGYVLIFKMWQILNSIFIGFNIFI